MHVHTQAFNIAADDETTPVKPLQTSVDSDDATGPSGTAAVSPELKRKATSLAVDDSSKRQKTEIVDISKPDANLVRK